MRERHSQTGLARGGLSLSGCRGSKDQRRGLVSGRSSKDSSRLDRCLHQLISVRRGASGGQRRRRAVAIYLSRLSRSPSGKKEISAADRLCRKAAGDEKVGGQRSPSARLSETTGDGEHPQ